MIGRLFDFLFSLEHVHVGRGTRFGFVVQPASLIVLGAVVLAVLGYLSYMPQAASPAKRRWMGVVRGILLAVVLMLACRPELIMEHEEPLRSVVAVWVDSSASMTLEDPYTGPGVDPAMRAYMQKVGEGLKNGGVAKDRARINRYELATGALGDTKWLKELTATQDVIFFTGSGRAESVGIASRPEDIDARLAQLKKMVPAGNTTDVPAVVRDILERVQGQRLSAIVLLTDGQTTERGTRLDQSAALALQADTKIFAQPVGQEEEPFNLRITTLQLPESTFTRDPVSARIHIAAAGITLPMPVKVTVYRKAANGALGEALAAKELTLDPAKKEVDAELPIRLKKTDPGKSERFDLVARVEPAGAGSPEERTLQDNERARTVTVLDAQINVLYVEGNPRWEFRYLRNELMREPTVNISTLLVSALDTGFVQDADPAVFDKATNEELFPGPLAHFPDTPADLAKYDVLLIGDVEPMFFSPAQQKLIVDWVKIRGGGLGWISGPNFNPETYRETALEVLMPITPDEIDPRARLMQPSDNMPYNLLLTPEGRNTNLFRFFDDSEASWKEVTHLPEMYWYKPVQGLKPGAIVLARHSGKSLAGSPAPLLVTRQFGAGPVLFSAYADTWRWRRYTGEPLFQSYWLQLCRLLYANKALGQSKRLELLAESGRVEIGGQIKLSLTVKDPTLSGQVPAEVPVMLTDKDGHVVETVTLRRSADSGEAGAGGGALERLEGTGTAGQLGEFSLAVRPGVLPAEVSPAELVVEQPQREFETTTADMQSLRSVTSKTGGAVVPLNHSDELMKQIPDRSLPILQTQSEELWSKPFALILVLMLATAEWLIRKSAGLI